MSFRPSRWAASRRAALFQWFVVGVAAVPPFSAAAQSIPPITAAAAAVEGRVSDAAGHPIPGASLSLVDGSGRVAAQGNCDADGHFVLRDVGAGRYTLIANRQGRELSRAAVDVVAGKSTRVDLRSVAQLNAVTVSARREAARNTLSPSTGGSRYGFDAQALESLPQGERTPLNQVLLQAPGVANDSYGQIHVRGDHADLQYRINDVILPEGVATFGQTLDTRFAKSVDLLTGALPAQYGYRTAGVVEINTKDGGYNGGSVDLYGGSHATLNPSAQLGFTQGALSGFVSGSYLTSKLGVEAPTDAYTPIHDRTEQGKGFGYFSYKLDAKTKLSAILGTAYNRFEIPNNPAQQPDAGYLAAVGLSDFDSTTLDERQYERTNYQVLALNGSVDRVKYQTAIFQRQSAVNYEPDPVGDLVFTGVSGKIKRKSATVGLQSDASLRIGESHTLRGGLFASREDDRADNTSTVFPTVDAASDGSCPNGTITADSGACVSGGPYSITDNNPKNGNTLVGLYAQDQWDISETFTLNYGLRYDRLDAYIRAQQLSPRLGFIWYATDATTVHGGYARYFTPPANELIATSSLQKFANTTNATGSTQNDPVQAERSHYFDLGVLQQLTPAFSVGLDAYYKYVRNLLDEGQFGSALIYTPFNYEQGHVYGLELSSSWRQGPWNAYFNLARSVAQATNVVSGQFNFDADELAYISNHYVYLDHDQRLSGSAGLSYDLDGTVLGTTATYGSGLRKDFANTGKLPPYLQIDLSATHTLQLGSFGPLDLRTALLNVTDRKYELRDGSGIGVGAPQYGPRRAIYFGIAKPFSL